MKKTILLFTMLLTFASFTNAQDARKPLDLVESMKANNASFQEVDVFNLDLRTSRNSINLEETVKEYNLFDLNQSQLRAIGQANPEVITLKIPTQYRSSFDLELVKVDIFTTDFSVIRKSDNTTVNVNTGVHYRGIIKGNNNSIAAISFYDKEIMGMISSSEGNLVIGKLQNQSSGNKHIIYNDQEVLNDIGFDCEMPDDGIGYKDKDLRFTGNTRAVGDCVRLYIEVDKDIHDNKGGVNGATNYVTGLMNEVITLYANEAIEAQVSQIVVWDVTSPYSSNNSSGMLSDFQANTSSINGNLGQLLSYQASGGIAAGFSGLCASNVNNSLSFSSIDASYATVPTFSWSVMVVTHEFGHLWGSRHTHACVWNGNNTAIDGCSGSTEGSCSLPGYPSQGGTLMSYCHLQSVGINFNEGFGPQPGNVIRNSVAGAACTSVCGPPSCTDGFQNGDETGVDCGGSTCPVCPTCTDGVMNGDEEGVDCGGSNCAPCPCLGNGVTLTILLDNYPEETSWEIKSGSTVVASGGTYGSQPDGSTVIATDCLADGCYDFVIYDSYGDGICCSYGSGNYSLVDDSNGAVLASGGAFSSSETTNFCVSGTVVSGCTDPSAHNYDPNANQDDGSCETCTDGIQNGDETGVDCGGALCGSCPIPGCTDPSAHNYDPNANQDDGSCETCTDGILNGDETDVDCGGILCAPCNTVVPGCTDPSAHNYNPGANQDDGSCETCTDGILNGDETGIDCGGALCGPCPIPGCTDPNAHNYDPNANQNDGSCETCSDSIQNGDETGVDCGGALCSPCSTGCTYVSIDFNDFDTEWGIWNDGGNDCRRSSSDGQYAVTGRPVRLRDNSSTSVMTTDDMNLGFYTELTVDFSYYPRSMDNANEDFWLQISTNGGGNWVTVEEWNRGDEFENNIRYYDTVVIPGPFTSNTRLRFRCDASGNNDYLYIDNVGISGCNDNSTTIGEGGKSLADNSINELTELSLSPNPVNEQLNVRFELEKETDVQLTITNIRGQLVTTEQFKSREGLVHKIIDVSKYNAGVYFIHINSESKIQSQKFVVISE